jgi:hypothetical protein
MLNGMSSRLILAVLLVPLLAGAAEQGGANAAKAAMGDPAFLKTAARIRKAVEVGDAKAFLAEVSPGGVGCVDSQVTVAQLTADLKGHDYFHAVLFDTSALRRRGQSLAPMYSMKEFLSRDPAATLSAVLSFPPKDDYVWTCWTSKALGDTSNPPCFTLRRIEGGRWVVVRIGALCD